MSNFCILIIDDEASIRDGFKRFLSSKFPQVTVLTAEDGNVGLQMAQMYKPDLILLDLSMPEMTGFEVLDMMFFIKLVIPVIVMTAFGSEANKDMVRVSSRNENIKILRKPVDLDELKTLIAQYVK
jgi:DNA-binding response OmpR family regulator